MLDISTSIQKNCLHFLFSITSLLFPLIAIHLNPVNQHVEQRGTLVFGSMLHLQSCLGSVGAKTWSLYKQG